MLRYVSGTSYLRVEGRTYYNCRVAIFLEFSPHCKTLFFFFSAQHRVYACSSQTNQKRQLQKVVRSFSIDMRLSSSRCWIELKKALVQHFVNFHYCSLITTSVAIVGSAEDCNDVHFMTPIVPVHNKLMSTRYQIQAILMVELLGYVLAKCKAGPAGADAPSGPIVRVGPKQVAHGPLVGYLLDSIELPHMVEGVDGGAQPTVETEYVVVDQGREREVVKEVGEELPNVGAAVLANALIIEAVHLRDLSGFVIAAKDEHSVGISHLETYKHRYGLDGVVAPIHCGIELCDKHQWTQQGQKLS